MTPKYAVCWTQKETCKTCGQVSSLQQTYRFFRAEDALAHAVEVLKQNATIIFINL